MPFLVNVGPPVLTINQGNTFMVTQEDGQIMTEGEFGVFADDTRFVSYYGIFANGQPWTRLNSSTTSYSTARVYLTNPKIETEDSTIPQGTLEMVLSRVAGDGIHEDIDITNHGLKPVKFNLEIALRSDFADIFEVKSHHYIRRGHINTSWNEENGELNTTYINRDFQRRFLYRVRNASSPARFANGRITFLVELAARESWHTCCYYILSSDGAYPEADTERSNTSMFPTECYEMAPEAEALHQQWFDNATQVTTAQEEVYRLYRQSVEDMGALRLYDPTLPSDTWVPAAGVPWFVTIFGRDSLIASLQCMLGRPNFALGTLKNLAQYQATEIDDWRDAQPGKMPHELRTGELAHFNRIPHTPYYGTADATPLYLILLHETWKWTGNMGLLHEYRDVALRCLDWIDRYGDLDGDGLQEFKASSPQGIYNQGWKDSGDAIVYPDGSQVKAPIALCELQGYVFDAWMRMAEVFIALGEPDRAIELKHKAKMLQAQFEEQFWCEELGFYAYALDADKQPVKSIVSNPGHCLWSGIVSPERAARVIDRLMADDLWSGWGIRTISADHLSFNPHSYHLGSIWAHDNGIIALGCKRYGSVDATAKIARGISEAASYFENYRLPEVYAGITQQKGAFPVQYAQANVPQAWAAGSIFHLLQAMLGLQADAPNGRLYIDPELPTWLPDITLRQLTVGNAVIELRCWREDDRTHWHADVKTGELEIVEKSWQPW
ncbi:glycogen debranching N-terminal domain-containing protein [Chamaesiphon polymorphus]|uniref:Amylo-alpha-1,6-glucosidase n=1 Tax=Chamaesiphon polymorphus CCALA 037 TaxID=2107692 RepID=A0A2T1GH45_9CYAN|nr:glycogen debranching N-terminal domain-containing protein [Chamaesiphon polymorphus]PSB57002.1 amylo-alpha-1,6-glucosidase [Chamaesiphon polymorphus CCALA 037]